MNRIAITGIGRTGTTYLSQVFQEAGYDFGASVKASDIGKGTRPVGGGMEHPEFVRAHVKMKSRSHEERLKIARQFLENHTPPEIVKDPRFLWSMPTWWEAGYRPDEILVSLRDWDEVKASFAATMKVRVEESGLPSLNDFLCWAARTGVPLSLVKYPDVGLNPEYADRVLDRLIANASDYTKAVWDQSLNHWSGLKKNEQRSFDEKTDL